MKIEFPKRTGPIVIPGTLTFPVLVHADYRESIDDAFDAQAWANLRGGPNEIMRIDVYIGAYDISATVAEAAVNFVLNYAFARHQQQEHDA